MVQSVNHRIISSRINVINQCHYPLRKLTDWLPKYIWKYINIILIPLDKITAKTNRTVKGQTNSWELDISKKVIIGAARELEYTVSGTDKIPINGTTNPMLTASANEAININKIRP